jgi:diguanylate cyclase (GGDEF)-like protein/PAS domain S-box-containing protein
MGLALGAAMEPAWALAGSLLAAVLALLVRERGLLVRLARAAEAMAALDMPMLILDTTDRVIWASAAFSRLYAGLGQVPVGMPYAELHRRVAHSGTIDLGGLTADAWLAQRLAQHRGADHVHLQRMSDGRCLQITERRTALGGWTSAAIDVTDLVQAQVELKNARDAAQSAQTLLEEALDAMPAGFEIWGRDDRLIRCNRRLLDLYPGAADLLQPGQPFEDVVRRTLELKLIPSARGRESEWLGERLASRGKMGRPVLMDYGGRWLQVDERRTKAGLLVCVRQDVTELVEARRALTQAQARAERQNRLLEHAVDALPVAVEIYNEHGQLQVVNRLFRNWHPGLDHDALIGRSFEQILRERLARGMLPPEAKADPEAWIAARVAQHGRLNEPQLTALPNGQHTLTQETRTPAGHVVVTRQDVTALVDKEQALVALHAQLTAVVETAGAGIVTMDGEGRVRSMNRAAQQLFGYPPDALIGKLSSLLFAPEARSSVIADFEAYLRGESQVLVGARREFEAQHAQARRLVIQTAISEVRKGSDRLFVAVVTDVTEQREAEAALREANAQLEHLSATDALTGLANRRRLLQQLQLLWRHALREGRPLAALLIDVDHFKRYNDHHGHQAGDATLCAVAEVLGEVARRSTDLAARYGGEEFVLLLDHCDLAGAVARAEELRERLHERALPHGDAPLRRVSVSIGVCSLVPDRDGRPEDLFSRADAALYRAKAAGRDRVEV